MSSFWRDTFTQFEASQRRQLVLRVGRRGGKSSSLCRFAVAFALAYPKANIPPGDLGVIAFISVNREEANQRLRTIRAILDALNIKYAKTESGVELEDYPIIFKTFAATIGGVSGFTSILVIADECAKWRNQDGSANPADEVLASVRPTMATQPDARIILSSSCMGAEDAHAKAFDLGDTEFQVVRAAKSWEANPTITEASTRKDEPDPTTWAREYANVPQVGGAIALDIEGLRACCRELRGDTEFPYSAEIVIDTSGGKNDAFVISVVAWVLEPTWGPTALDAPPVGEAYQFTGNQYLVTRGPFTPPQPKLWLAHVSALEGDIAKTLSTSDVANEIARIARHFGATRVHGDQYGAWSWASDLAKRGLVFEEHPWTSSSKTNAVLRLRDLIRSRTLVIDIRNPKETEKLIGEGTSFVQTILPSGAISFGARGKAHDDRIMTLLMAARVDTECRLEGSPLAIPVYRRVAGDDQQYLDAA